MDDNTNRIKKLEAIKTSLSPREILYRSEAAHLVEIPTPLTFSILSTLFSYDGALGQAYKAMDLPIAPFETTKYVHQIFGRIYFNLRTEEEFIHHAMGMTFEITQGKPELKKVGNWFSALPATLRNMVSNSFIISQKSLHLAFAQETIEQLKALPAVTNFHSSGESLYSELKNEIAHLNQEYAAIFRLAYLEGLLAKELKPEQLQQLSNQADMKDLYVESSKALGKPETTINTLTVDFGNRSFNDFELAAPRWSETPEILEKLLEQNSPAVEPKKQEERITSASARELQKIIVLKDNLRFFILNRVKRIRQLLVQLGITTGLNDSVFYLSLEELETATRENIVSVAKAKKELFEEEKIYFAPDLITTTATDSLVISSQSEHKATPVSVGKASGEVVRILAPTDTAKAGTILVLPNAGPEYTNLYANAIGLIFETGGVLSHGSIIAREMGLPAVVSRLPVDISGVVELDATKGQITFHTST